VAHMDDGKYNHLSDHKIDQPYASRPITSGAD
jgi:hypothetical protein